MGLLQPEDPSIDMEFKRVQIISGACYALGELRIGEAVDPLINLLSDTNFHVVATACMALGEIGDPRAIEPIEMIGTTSKFEWVRYWVQDALKKIAQ